MPLMHDNQKETDDNSMTPDSDRKSILIPEEENELDKKNTMISQSPKEGNNGGDKNRIMIQDERIGDAIGSYLLTRKLKNLVNSNIFLHSARKNAAELDAENTGSNYLDHLLWTLPENENQNIDSSGGGSSTTNKDKNTKYKHGRRPFSAGSYGSVWLAERSDNPDVQQSYDSKEWRQSIFVLKKIKTQSYGHRLSAMREVHFGNKFAGYQHIVRFVEYFETSDAIWLVFLNEGRSLQDLLYTKKDLGNILTFVRSNFWNWLREEEKGQIVMREIWRDILKGVEIIHERKTTHRDIKPSNIFINQDIRRAAVVGDFGNSVDTEVLKKYYSMYGPSKNESTLNYAPPEVIFGENPYSLTHPGSYDLWSVGVLFLEMWLGQSDVFELDKRVAARIDRHMLPEDGLDRKLRHLLISFMETCIYENFSEGDPSFSVMSKACLQKLGIHVKRLDPLGRGIDEDLLDLVQRLLQWNPMNRIEAEDALKHRCFQNLSKSGDVVALEKYT